MPVGIEHEWGSGEQCLGEHTTGVATSVQDNKIATHGASPTSYHTAITHLPSHFKRKM